MDKTVDQSAERELHIEFTRDESARFVGSAAQLLAEGLIPKGFKWPEGSRVEHWKAGGLLWRLYRVRPEGHKGSKRSWMEIDNWMIQSWQDVDRLAAKRRRIERRAEELKELYFRECTFEGAKLDDEAKNRFVRALSDDAFQSFKSRIPALVRPKRGRKPKA